MQKAIVLVAGGHAMGGAERRFIRTYAALSEKDPDIHLVISHHLYRLALEMGLLDRSTGNIHQVVNWDWLPPSKWRYLYWIIHSIQLTWYVIHYRFRILHMVMTGVFTGFFPMHLPGVKSIVTIVSSRLSIYSKITKPLYRQILRRVDLIDVLSPSIKTKLLASEIYSPGIEKKIRIAACSFTDYTHFKPADEKLDRIVYASRFEPIKSPKLMMVVAKRVAAQLPEVEIYVAGFGSLEKDVLALWNDMPPDIQSRVFVGSIPDLAPVMARAKLAISLQQTENYPSQAILEAMACKCAVVATDVGDTHLFVDDEVGARVSFDPDEIAEVIVNLFQNQAHLQALGEAAYQRAINEFSLERFLQYVQTLYQELLVNEEER